MASKFLAKKRLGKKSIDNGSILKGFSRGESFNKETTYLKGKTKFLIVGTYTPLKGRETGYFYCSETNHMYEIIDNVFEKIDHQSLVSAKKNLISYPNDPSCLEGIKTILNNRGISFLDVVKEAVSKDCGSKDSDIDQYVLDYESFENVDFEKTAVVANSNNAFKALEFIINNSTSINKTGISKIQYIPQSVFGHWNICKTKKDLNEKWSDFFKTKKVL